MPQSFEFYVEKSAVDICDVALVELLTKAYVGGGFTSCEFAKEIFQASMIKSRGDIVSAWSTLDEKLVGVVIVVMPGQPARRMANTDEAELHLLAVDPRHHGLGVGRSLVTNALGLIESRGLRRTVLWTQPSMLAAQNLYKSLGFTRNPIRDPIFDDMKFMVYEHCR